MVGIVIVSHSQKLAEGVVELARQMAGPDVPIIAAGGLREPVGAIGTDIAVIGEALDAADQGDGVLVLMDLGSAILSTEMARDMLAP
ncbi:MAG TPA: PTS-dependent dihydroxyacetone kinase phosphotransferase subunit DhaM, partial [Anaerolineales bacterium]|nr:PTS-dependent dihydroxyacetone kinase phosphotransferase subunit DhaM [Anaerolineales bacterium]